MKESERLRIEAEQTDNDLAALGKYTKVLRVERKEKFEETWLEKLQEQTVGAAFHYSVCYRLLILIEWH